MTRPLQVLVLESHPSEGAATEAALLGAGHRVVRCHEPGAEAFPCVGLVDRAACPLHAGIDVAVDVRRADAAEPTAREDGTRCALREGVPVVEISSVPSPMSAWTIPGGTDVVASVEAAAATAFEALRTEIVARVEPLFIANGVPPCRIDCELEREGRRLLVHLVGPPVGRGLRQAASVRAYDVVRESDRSFDEIRLGYRPVVAV